MNVRNLFKDDDAVSPVIGVILMVAITVILAAVIGAFVLNIGGSQDTAPSVSFDFSNESGQIYAKHAGGDQLDTDQLSVTASGSGVGTSSPGWSGTWSAGTKYQVGTASGSGELSIVWSSPSTDKTQIIGTYQV